MKAYAEIAVAFASALVEGDFARAQALLSPSLREDLPPPALHQHFHGMFSGYAEGKPTRAECDDQFCMEKWPAKQAGDVGWAYVSIEGEDFVEAVTVVVADVDGELLIRAVEWGRP